MLSAKSDAGEVKTWTLAKEEELRIEVDAELPVTITVSAHTPPPPSPPQLPLMLALPTDPPPAAVLLISMPYCQLLRGTAEVFGSELSAEHDYVLSEVKLAVFSWHGCELSVKGRPRSAYTANETPMVTYINAHAALEALRQQAAANASRGPVVVVCGPVDVGKSSLTRLLVNYAVRAGHAPLLVDVDVGQNCISVPGSVAATTVEQPIPIDSAEALTVKAPLVHYYAHGTPNQQELYKHFLNALSATITKRFAASATSRTSGAIINTAGWVDGGGYEVLVHIANAFHADVIMAVGHERLYADLKADARITASVVKLAKSGGVVGRTGPARAAARNKAVREYFYGPAGDLCPHQKTFGWREVSVWRVGGGPAAPASALPIGAPRMVDPNALQKVTVGLELLHAVMAVSYSTEASTLMQKNVAGFVFVSAVDAQKKTLTLLTPAPGPLPSMCFLTGTVKWSAALRSHCSAQYIPAFASLTALPCALCEAGSIECASSSHRCFCRYGVPVCMCCTCRTMARQH